MTEHLTFAAEVLVGLLITGAIAGYVLRNYDPDYDYPEDDEDPFL